jgi:hypothetical protein
MPSPDVWAAISKGLPSTPPSAPAATTPTQAPAVGGGASSIILKGLIGAALVALIGTTVYFMTGREKNAVEPEVPENKTESTEIQQALKTSEPTGVVTKEAEADNNSLPPQASNNGMEIPDQASSVTEKAEPTASVDDIPNQGPAAEKGTAVHKEALQPNADRRLIPTDPGTVKDSRLSGVTKTPVPTGKKPSSSTRISNGSFRMPAVTSDIRRAAAPVDNALVPISLASKVAPEKAEVAIDRRNMTSNMKVVNASRMPSAAPSIQTPFGSVPVGAQKASAPLKRNDWRSRIYLTPMMSLNMTKMEVEENRSYGPRIGREHIEFRETENTKTTLSPGLIAGFAITPRISVQSGVSELRNDINVSPKQIKAVRDRDGKIRYRMDCSSGSYYLEPKPGTTPSVGDSLRIVSSDIKMRYVSIPLSVRVNVGNEKVRLFATAGADVNILANKQTSTTFAGSSSDKVSPVRSEGTRKQYLNGTLGAGVEIKAGKRLGIMLMPQYRFPLSNMNEEGPVLTYPKTFSISSGVRIGF